MGVTDIQCNKIEVNSIPAFERFEGSACPDGKEVCFVRGIGVHTDYLSEIARMDNILMERMNQGRGLYQRIDALPIMKSMEDISFYAEAYDDWMKAGRKEMFIRTTQGKVKVATRLSVACLATEEVFKNIKKQATDTIVKNFVVKLLFWYDAIFSQNRFDFDNEKTIKLVAANIVKQQEYLFFYMVSMMGVNVLLLQSKADISPEEEKLGYSTKFVLGELKEVKIPSYEWKESKGNQVQSDVTGGQDSARQAGADAIAESVMLNQSNLNSNGRITVKIPERNRPSKHPATQVQNQQTNTQETSTSGRNNQQQGNPRVVIPPRPGSSVTKEVPAGRPVKITTPARPTVVGSNEQRPEKSFEELAMLASSIVLIAVFDEKGERLGSGSGIMIGKEGYILTNNHVAAGGRSFMVRIEDDDNEYRTDEIVKYHSVLDLAIIRIQRKLNPLPVYKGSKPLVRGQKVVAIGSPLGLFNSVSNGIVSGFRKINDVDMIQFTAPTSRGSSGGAVLNMQGEVIGISTAGIDEGQNINLAMGYECINMFIKGFI